MGRHYQEKGDRVREREYYRKYIQALKEATADPKAPWADRGTERWKTYSMLFWMWGMENEVEEVLHQCLTIEEQVLGDGLVVQSERERLQALTKSLLADYLASPSRSSPCPPSTSTSTSWPTKGRPYASRRIAWCAISPS